MHLKRCHLLSSPVISKTIKNVAWVSILYDIPPSPLSHAFNPSQPSYPNPITLFSWTASTPPLPQPLTFMVNKSGGCRGFMILRKSKRNPRGHFKNSHSIIYGSRLLRHMGSLSNQERTQ